MTQLEGAILVGGRSRRMGRDKSGLLVGGQPMLDRIIDAVSPIVGRLRLVGSGPTGDKGITSSIATAYEHQPDLEPGLGPLAGIHAAMSTAEAPAVLIVACDLPFVTERFLRGLCAALTAEHEAVVPKDASGRLVAVCAVYRTSCLSSLELRLKRHELAARDFAASIRTRYLEGETLLALDPKGLCLKNINTPAELEEARRIADP